MKSVKFKLVLVSLLFASFYSCTKDQESNGIIEEYSKIFHHTDYDEIRDALIHNTNIMVQFNGNNIVLENLKVAKGITIENSILLGNDQNDYVLINDITNRIYLKKSDYDRAIQTEVYFFKNKLDKSLVAREYNLENLENTPGKFIEKDNAYLIQKIIPKTEAEIANSLDYSLSAGCGTTEDDKITPSISTEKDLQSSIVANAKVNMLNTWNIYIYKKSSSVDASSSVVNFYTSWKSLRGSDSYYYSDSPYANINIIYNDFSYTDFIPDGDLQLFNFKSVLESNNASEIRSIHVFMTGNDRWDTRGKAFMGKISTSTGELRCAIVSTVNDQCLAHEIGHCLGSNHENNTYWDTSIGWFGLRGSDVMCTPLGSKAWNARQYHRFYNLANRIKARRVLDFY